MAHTPAYVVTSARYEDEFFSSESGARANAARRISEDDVDVRVYQSIPLEDK